MGDFNYPGISWESGPICHNANTPTQNFVDEVRAACLIQSVVSPTRTRVNQNSNVLDLVLSNYDNIDNLKHSAPIGKSDHHVLSFDITVNFTNEKILLNHTYSIQKATIVT